MREADQLVLDLGQQRSAAFNSLISAHKNTRTVPFSSAPNQSKYPDNHSQTEPSTISLHLL